MLKLRSLARLCVLALALPLVWGCYKYKEMITIEQGGKGTVHITASIPEKSSKDVVYYDSSKITGKVPPPITAGLIENMFLGSKQVKVASRVISPEPVDGQWQYDIIVEFASVDALKLTRYFSNRAISLSFPGGRQMKFTEKLSPTLIEMAKAEAKSLPKDAYAPMFLVTASAPDFNDVVGSAEVSYGITMPGIDASVDPTAQCTVAGNPDNTTTATWNYSAKDLSAMTPPPTLSMAVALPAERGFMPIVIVLLLASVVGILAPAIRLLMLKSRHSA
jgi:hypothetical protein